MPGNALFEIAGTKWNWERLADVCRRGGGDIQTGPFGSQLHASDYVEVGVPSIMPQNISQDRVDPAGIARITPKDAERLSRYLVKPGDIVYSRRGDVERRALITKRESGWLCGTGCLRVRFGDGIVDPVYAAYFLSHPASREWVVRHAVGATMANLNTSILGALPFLLPPLPEQRAIAAVLGALDDKIEQNRRTARALERLARAIFRAWFVDFDPVKAKAAGAAGFPSMPRETFDALPARFVDSEIGPVPEGWEVKPLGAVARQVRQGVRPSEIDSGTPYIGLEHMPRRSITLSEWEHAGKVTSGKARFCAGQLLFGKLRPYFHKVGIAALDGVCSTDIVVVEPKSPEYLALTLGHASSDEFVAYTTACSTGTNMPRTKWGDMARYPLAVPPNAVAVGLNAVILPMIDLLRTGIFESRKLAEMRDYLLPKLLSGEVRPAHAQHVRVETFS